MGWSFISNWLNCYQEKANLSLVDEGQKMIPGQVLHSLITNLIETVKFHRRIIIVYIAMPVPIIKKNMNPFETWPRQSQNTRIHYQNIIFPEMTKSTNVEQNFINDKTSPQQSKRKATIIRAGSLRKSVTRVTVDY